MPEKPPQLSKEDREAIARAIYHYMKEDLYHNAGKGVVNLGVKLIMLGFFALAVYGYSRGWFG